MSDYNEYFKRQIELWGQEKQDSLKDKKILIIGAGGLGSSLSFALGCSGIGKIDIVDFDTVSIHNIHRQITFFIYDEWQNKAKVVAQRIKDKNPFVTIEGYDMDFKTFMLLDKKYDLILDATDNFETREQIDAYAKANSTPWIYASVEEFNGQICFFEASSFSVFNTAFHKPKGISAPMVMTIASIGANMALRHLVGLEIQKDKLFYIYFNTQGEFINQSFSVPKL
ncbi:MAG: thiamine biosynthesis protein ThiF [Sulfurovum sp. AS07-7]|nr:MAG: thiamine biosynthesis protein ThiF [Sulfurovum sp. AS07-7]